MERRANFIGSELNYDQRSYFHPTFEGTVAKFTLKACKVTPSVPTAVPSVTAIGETDAPTTAAPEKDDSGTPWWMWLMIGLGTLLVMMVVGGVLLWFCRRGNGTSPPTFDSYHIQTDHGASELLNYGGEDACLL